MIVQEFDLTVKHRSGKDNANADALSRNPIRSDKHPSSTLTAQSSEVELCHVPRSFEKYKLKIRICVL